MLHLFARLALVFIGCLASARCAGAEVTTDRGASVLVFPKVFADGGADTTIQLTNLSDNSIAAHCLYVDGTSGSWQSVEFTFALEPERPVQWTVAHGRMAAPEEDPPIDIPAAPASFRGELLCVQVDGTGAPSSGNELAGHATITALASGNVSAYAAIGLRGTGLENGDEFLCLGDAVSDNCFLGVAEYDACSDEWILSVPAEDAGAALSPEARLSTRVTVVPCSQNLRDGSPSTVDIEITVFNEMAEQFAGRLSVTCWQDVPLAELGGQIFDRAMLGSDYVQSRWRPAGASGSFMLVAETTRATGDASIVTASTGINPHHRGSATNPDVIILPPASPPP